MMPSLCIVEAILHSTSYAPDPVPAQSLNFTKPWAAGSRVGINDGAAVHRKHLA